MRRDDDKSSSAGRDILGRQCWQETLGALDSVKQGRLVDEDSVRQWLVSWGTEGELPPPNYRLRRVKLAHPRGQQMHIHQ